MKIVTWNCNGALRKKTEALDALDADVYVVQECEDPAQSTDAFRDWAGSYLWVGTSKHKGLGVFPKKGNTVKLADWFGAFKQLGVSNSHPSTSWSTADLKLFPTFLDRLSKEGGTPQYARPQCVGDVRSKGQGELQKDINALKAAMAEHGVERGFMNAASPGVISLFLQNAHYPTREAYLAALADAMRDEYRTILDAGLDLQLDCPDLALSRHMLFTHLTDAEFLNVAATHVEALNHALTGLPQDRIRLHICWGNYEGPHVCDIDMAAVFRC